MEEENLLDSNFAIKVPKLKSEKVITDMKEKGNYDYSRDIIIEGDFLWIPIKNKIQEAQRKELPKKGRLSTLKKRYKLRAFDIIGELIIIFIPEEMLEKRKEIGNHLMKMYPKIKAVYREVSKVKGEFRVQKLELIAGNGSETIHKEQGLKFKMDITKVFFSPRQITERLELTKLIQKDKSVCVFFSGIAPIPIYLAKFTKTSKIIGIELNTDAHHYAEENLKLNNVNNVELINGDVKKEIPKIAERELFDYVIMPLPKNARSFIDTADSALKDKGILAIYFVGSKIQVEKKIEEIKRKRYELIELRKGAEIAPREYRFTIIAEKNRKFN